MSIYRSSISKPSRLKSWFKLISITILFMAISAFIAWQVFLFVNRANIEKYFSEQSEFGILLIGQTGKDQQLKTRFISVVGVFPSTSRLGFISLFPQTRLKEKEAMISQRLSFGSVDNVMSDLSTLTGLPVKYYINITAQDISRGLDLVDGLPYYLQKSDILEDEQLPSGEFMLDGSLVKRLVDTENKNEYSPAFRLFRHYSLILNFWQVRQNKWQILQNKTIFQKAIEQVDTSLGYDDLYFLATTFFESDNWLPMFMEVPIKRLGDDFVMDTDATALYLKNFQKKLESKENPYIESPPKMEVKNGAGIANLARKMRRLLSRKGIQVLEFSNADHQNYEQTILLDLSANTYYLDTIAKLLEAPKAYHTVNRSLFTDLALVLGKDYKELKTD